MTCSVRFSWPNHSGSFTFHRALFHPQTLQERSPQLYLGCSRKNLMLVQKLVKCLAESDAQYIFVECVAFIRVLCFWPPSWNWSPVNQLREAFCLTASDVLCQHCPGSTLLAKLPPPLIWLCNSVPEFYGGMGKNDSLFKSPSWDGPTSFRLLKVVLQLVHCNIIACSYWSQKSWRTTIYSPNFFFPSPLISLSCLLSISATTFSSRILALNIKSCKYIF